MQLWTLYALDEPGQYWPEVSFGLVASRPLCLAPGHHYLEARLLQSLGSLLDKNIAGGNMAPFPVLLFRQEHVYALTFYGP